MKEENEKELLKLKREFSLKYILTQKMLEVYLFFALFIMLCFASKRVVYSILAIIVFLLVVFGKIVIEKRRSNQTVMKFYEDRIQFKGRIFFVKVNERTLKYNEIKDITVTQGSSFLERRFQKKFGYGNIYVYPKKGNLLTNGMQIELVANINEKIEELKQIIGDKVG